VRRIALVGLCLAGPLAAQGGALAEAAQAARAAWQAHDVEALVAHSPRVVLQIPGADPSAPLARTQAAVLLGRYLTNAVERSVVVATVREVESGTGFVELERRYVVRGTTDERRETVFLGFGRAADRWVLVEVRTAG
jgi:hypothetical protein